MLKLKCRCCGHELSEGTEYRIIYSGDAKLVFCESCICDKDCSYEIVDVILNYGDVLEDEV